MNIFFDKYTIDDLSFALKKIKKLDKIVKSNQLLNKYYEAGNIIVYVRDRIPTVEVNRIVVGSEYLHMDKQTKDKITSYLKKNNCVYTERWDAYIYY